MTTENIYFQILLFDDGGIQKSGMDRSCDIYTFKFLYGVYTQQSSVAQEHKKISKVRQGGQQCWNSK